jgi:hypothetical protein
MSSIEEPDIKNASSLSYCWVCKDTFSHAIKREEHHVIPRAYGGENGPIVSLCDSHHTAIHEIASHLFLRKSFNHLLESDKQKTEKLLYLANIAYNARVLVENDPNKPRVIIIQNFKGDTHTKLVKLKTLYPKLSRSKIIEIAIQRLYNNHFLK